MGVREDVDLGPRDAARPEHDGRAQAGGERPRIEQRADVVIGDQACLAGSRQRRDRAGGPQRRDRVRVPELEQLGSPLDVGHSPAPELEVPRRVDAAGQPLRLDACLDAPDLAHVGDGEPAGRVAHRLDELREPRGQLLRRRRRRLPGERPGAQQRLGLPDRRPALVVLGVRGERPHERSLPPLGPQVGVHGQVRLRSDGAEQLAHAGRRRHGELAGQGRVGTRHGVVHEHDVGVRAVAHLPPAESAHRHDQQARGVLVETQLVQHGVAGEA